jgi:hypothetical protein
VLEFTVAIVVLLLLHVPPALPVEVYVTTWPIVNGVGPLTVSALALGLTVSIWKEDVGLPQPVLTVYVILVVPALTPKATPVFEFTVATVEFELLQVPPEVPLLVKVVIVPIHIGEGPVTVPADTFGVTVKFRVLLDTVVGFAQGSLLVITTRIESPLANALSMYVGLLDPTLAPFFFH